MNFWNVYLNEKLIETVFFTKDCDIEYVKSSLVDHDGFSSEIRIENSHK
jgi:hypothetical protein